MLAILGCSDGEATLNDGEDSADNQSDAADDQYSGCSLIIRIGLHFRHVLCCVSGTKYCQKSKNQDENAFDNR